MNSIFIGRKYWAEAKKIEENWFLKYLYRRKSREEDVRSFTPVHQGHFQTGHDIADSSMIIVPMILIILSLIPLDITLAFKALKQKQEKGTN